MKHKDIFIKRIREAVEDDSVPEWQVIEIVKNALDEYRDTPKAASFPIQPTVPEWVEWITVDVDGDCTGHALIPEKKYPLWISNGSMINIMRMDVCQVDKAQRWHREGNKWVER